MSQKVDERVLVVPSTELDRLGRFQGFSGEVDRYITALLVPELMQYRPRSEVEDDPGYKQIIPYVVFRREAKFRDEYALTPAGADLMPVVVGLLLVPFARDAR